MPDNVKRSAGSKGVQGVKAVKVQPSKGRVLPIDREARFLSSVSALVSRIEAFQGKSFSSFKGARDLYSTLGYSNSISINDHRERYRRGGIAKRVIDFYPREIWAGGFEVYDDDNPKIGTKFQLAFESIGKRIPIIKQFKRADKLARLGRYSVLLIGVADNKPLDQEMGKLSGPDQVSYLTPYAEDRAEVIELVRGDNERSNPRFGLPLYYKLKQSSNNDHKPGSKLYIPDVKVHWSRIIHITTDPLEDDLCSIPQLEPIWNLLDDLYKIVGGGSEAAWNQATQLLHAKLDPNLEFEPGTVEDLDDKMKEVSHKLRRMLMTQGVDINALSTQVDKFAANGDFVIDLICGTESIQKRILLGSERGELASTQDRQNKIDTISAMRLDYAEPTVVRQLIDRLVQYGGLPKPVKDEYTVAWVSEEKLSEKEKAEAAKLRAEANKAQVEAEGRLITTSDEIRDDIYGKEPLSLDEEDSDLEESDLDLDIEPVEPEDNNKDLSVSSSNINNVQKVIKRNLNSFTSLILEHFQGLEISSDVLENPDKLDLSESTFIDTISNKILSVMIESSKPAAKLVKSRVQSRFNAVNIKLDITNPRAVEFARSRSSELIKEIGPETVKGVKELIADAIEEGITPNKISQVIRDKVGLRSDQVQAVNNLRDELRTAEPGSLITRFPADGKNRDLPGLRIRVPKSGVTEEWIKTKTDKYAQMQLNYRGRLIARTELSTSANEGLRETWRQSIENGYLPENIKRIWLANTDRHADMDGQKVGIDEDFDPPIEPGQEPNCILPGSRVAGKFIAGSKAFYYGPAVEIETSRGFKVSVTVNHPIFTNELGWISANKVTEGMNLISYIDKVRSLSLPGNIDDNYFPALIEDVFESISVHGSSRLTKPCTTLDFYGDQEWMQGDVNIVGTDRELMSGVITESSEEINDVNLPSSNSGFDDSGVSSLGSEDLSLDRVSVPSSTVPSSGTLLDNGVSVLANPFPLEVGSLGTPSNWNVIKNKSSLKNGSTNSAFVRDLFERSSGEVAFDKVVKVRNFSFRGHVYDLQSVTGWIIAEGILISNCGCSQGLEE